MTPRARIRAAVLARRAASNACATLAEAIAHAARIDGDGPSSDGITIHHPGLSSLLDARRCAERSVAQLDIVIHALKTYRKPRTK